MKKLISATVLSFTLALIIVDSASAWGPQAHRAIGWIADRQLTPHAKFILKSRFKIHHLEKIATWADTVRKKKKQGSWHYVNIEEGELIYEKERDCRSGQCVVEKIFDFKKVLADISASDKEKATAIKYLTHLVGDAHQPLHAGNSRDRGGNNIKLQYKGDKTNLHALWDSGLLQGGHGKMPEYAKRLNHSITPEFIAEGNELAADAWVNESRIIALEHAYNPPVPMNKEYIRRSREIIDLRIRQAGVRLALLLNQALD